VAIFYPWWLYSTRGGYFLPVVAKFYVSRAARNSGMGQGTAHPGIKINSVKGSETFYNLQQVLLT